MKRIINYLRGLVCLQVTGNHPERFLNLLSGAGIPFFELERPEAMSLRLWIYQQHRSQARRLAARAWCETEILGERGFPQLRKRLKKRWALLTLPLLAVFSALILSLFIWEI